MVRSTDLLDWLPPVLDRCRQVISEANVGAGWSKVSARDPNETVTEADLAVEALLVEAIRRQEPGAGILSEESFSDGSVLDGEGLCFVIDPIDGTDELVQGRPGYAISVALFRGGRPAAAVLDLPAHDWRFTGVVGEGAFLNGERVTISAVDRVADARLAVSATQRGASDLARFWAGVGARSLVPTPAFAAKVAAVLAGVCDAALYLPVRPYPTAVWDYAAAATLLVEAGGWYGTTQGDDLLDQRPYLYEGGWIAGPASLRDELVTIAHRVPQRLTGSTRTVEGPT